MRRIIYICVATTLLVCRAKYNPAIVGLSERTQYTVHNCYTNIPDTFDDTRAKFGNYATQMQLQFRSDPAAFPSEESKIIFAGSFLTGIAYTWFYPYIDKYTGAVEFQAYAAFVAAFYARAVSVFSLLGWTEEPVLIYHFRKGLKENLKDALVGKTLPKKFSEFASFCITLDNDIYARIREKKNKPHNITPSHISPPQNPPSIYPAPPSRVSAPVKIPSNNTSHSAPSSTPAYDPMELDNSEAGKAARKAYRWANNLCGYCGNSGHKVVTCPTLLVRRNPLLSNVETVNNEASPSILYQSKN